TPDQVLRPPSGGRFARPARAARQRLRLSGPQRSRQEHHDQNAHRHGPPRLGQGLRAGRRRRRARAGRPGADRLPGRRASALSLDDGRRDGPLRPCVLPDLERPVAGADSRPLRPATPRQNPPAVERPAGAALAGLAVAPDPELLILDDPTLGLDTVVRREFLESLIQVIQRRGRTILFSSHILGDVERVADRIGILVDGVLRVDCPTDAFKESVRKIVLQFGRTPPAFPGCRGLVSSRQAGANLELIVVGYGDEQRQACEALEPRAIDVIELNLEDAFIEYTRGPRRSLPIFATENRDVESLGA